MNDFYFLLVIFPVIAGIILFMCLANERCRYTMKPSLIGWAHTHNDPCSMLTSIWIMNGYPFQLTTSFSTSWLYDMETVSKLLALCDGNPLVTGGFPSQKEIQSFHKGLVMWHFDIVFANNLSIVLNALSSCQWFEMIQCSCEITVMKPGLINISFTYATIILNIDLRSILFNVHFFHIFDDYFFSAPVLIINELKL